MILQYIYRDDPWKMLCGCIMLNLTTRRQVDRVWDEVFARYPDSLAMSQADEKQLGLMIKSLGMWRKRAHTLIEFSKQWTELTFDLGERLPVPETVGFMHGIGKYALDSYKIFVLGWAMTPSQVDDKELKRYLEQEAYLGRPSA